MKSLSLEDIFELQNDCRRPIQALGYTFIKEEKDLKSHTLPAEKTIEDIWLTNLP